MPNRTVPSRPRRVGATAAMVGTLVIVFGALFVFGRYLVAKRDWRTSVADATVTNSPIFSTVAFGLPAHERVCMNSVTVTPNSALAAFEILSRAGIENQGLPLELMLSAPGYEVAANLLSVAGFSGRVEFQITPPRRSLLATACLLNRGATPVSFRGTTAPRTTSRSALTIAGKRVGGNLTLAFYERRPRSRLVHLGDVFEHVSNLTDRLVPVWLVWLLIISTFLAVPIGILLALHRSLREDETAT